MATSPKTLNPIGNPINLKVVSTNHVQTSGVFASLSFNIDYSFNVGDSLGITAMGIPIEFDFVETPDNSGNQLQGWYSGMSWADWFNAVIAGLQANYYLGSFYAITGKQATKFVSITALTVGANYNIKFTGTIPGQISDEKMSNGAVETYKPNFGIYARIKDAETGEVLGTDKIAGANVLFDFHVYLKDFVYSKIYWPEVADAYPIANTEAVKEFFIEYWEQATGYFSKITKTPNYKAITGGVNKAHESRLDADLVTYADLFKSGDILVQTSRPATSHISLNQPLHVYFINNLRASKSFSLDMVIHYTDGTSQAHDMEQSITVAAWAQGCLYVSPGIKQLAAVEPSKTISKLVVKIESNTGEESDPFTLIPYWSPWEKYLMFKNSFGAYDFVTFFGIAEQSDKYKREMFDNSSNEKTTLNVVENEQMNVMSGWLSLTEREWLRDLLISRQVYVVNGQDLELYAIENSEFLRNMDSEYLYGIELEMSRTQSNEFYSKQRTDDQTAGSGWVIGTEDYVIGTDDYEIGTN